MILLVCDHVKREIHNLRTLKDNLNKLNIKAKIINKHSILRAYNYYKPKIIVFPHARLFLADTINRLHKKVKLILIPSEHCALRVDFIKLHYCGYLKGYNIKSSHNKMDYIFVQGPFIKNHLIWRNLLTSPSIKYLTITFNHLRLNVIWKSYQG